MPDLRTDESIRKQRKIGHKTRFVYFGSPNIAPCQPIIKPRRKNSINHIRFCRFANCSSAYSPCVPVGVAHENCVFIWCIRTNIGTLAYPVGSALTKIKTTQKVVLIFGSPNRIRTGVLALKGRCPRPLDDGAKTAGF